MKELKNIKIIAVDHGYGNIKTAIGQCYRLVQELQYAIETLPVDVNTYLRFGADIQKEIDLIKGWRKSDNKFKTALSQGNL